MDVGQRNICTSTTRIDRTDAVQLEAHANEESGLKESAFLWSSVDKRCGTRIEKGIRSFRGAHAPLHYGPGRAESHRTSPGGRKKNAGAAGFLLWSAMML